MLIKMDLKYIDYEIKCLNCKILSKCISSTFRSPHVSGHIESSKAFNDYLIQNFGLTKWYKKAQNILECFQFETKRFFNEHDYCCVLNDSFMMRVSNPRKLNYFSLENGKLLKKFITYKYKIHFKFLVKDEKNVYWVKNK